MLLLTGIKFKDIDILYTGFYKGDEIILEDNPIENEKLTNELKKYVDQYVKVIIRFPDSGEHALYEYFAKITIDEKGLNICIYGIEYPLN